VRGLGLLALTLFLSGCADLPYLGQSVAGHLRLVSAARPVDEWTTKPDTSPALRERLLLTQRMRDFAISELHLPDNDSYRRYADLHREAAVWNVVAAPELSLTPKAWCFPVMGCVAYRGYFDQAEAKAFGDQLKAEGWAVQVYPVPAYSSLGWTRDPLLSTFVGYPEGALAEMMFHELAHQRLYVAGDTAFNEAFATAVGEMGAKLWLERNGSPAAQEAYRVERARSVQFLALTGAYRQRLLTLYASAISDEDKQAQKAALMQALRADYMRLKIEQWGGYAGYDRWFAQANNASFALLATYTERVPEFVALFEREGRDWERFYAAARRLTSGIR